MKKPSNKTVFTRPMRVTKRAISDAGSVLRDPKATAKEKTVAAEMLNESKGSHSKGK